MMHQNHFQCVDFRKKSKSIAVGLFQGSPGECFEFISVYIVVEELPRKFKFLAEMNFLVQELTSADHKRWNKRICTGKFNHDYRWSWLCLISISIITQQTCILGSLLILLKTSLTSLNHPVLNERRPIVKAY